MHRWRAGKKDKINDPATQRLFLDGENEEINSKVRELGHTFDDAVSVPLLGDTRILRGGRRGSSRDKRSALGIPQGTQLGTAMIRPTLDDRGAIAVARFQQ